eukprot:PhM_4_TR19114/c0_g1_i1/m.81065
MTTTSAVRPQEDQSWRITRLLFFWVTPLLTLGYARDKERKNITTDELFDLAEDEQAQNAYNRFLVEWEREKAEAPNRKKVKNAKGELVDPQPSLARALTIAFRVDLMLGAFWSFVQQATLVAQPFMLLELLRYFGKFVDKDPATPNNYDGYLWGIGLTGLMLISSFGNHGNLFYSTKACCNMRSALSLAIYDKVAKLESSHRFSGHVQQMHGADVLKFIELGTVLQNTWVSFFTLLAGLVALYFFIGWAGVMSIMLLVAQLPLQAFLARKMLYIRASGARIADGRIKSISEYLQGIRVVKFMCWEKEIQKNVRDVRSKEVDHYWKLMFVRGGFSILASFIPVSVVFAVMAIAYALDNDAIEPESVFPTMAMLNILRAPLAFLPLGIARCLEVLTSTRRIAAFLLCPDRHEYVEANPDSASSDAIVMTNCTVQFPRATTKNETAVEMSSKKENNTQTSKNTDNSKGAPPAPAPAPAAARADDFASVFARGEYDDAMTDINITIPRGKLTIVIGPTGGGKSTLISLMSGEAIVKPGSKVVINGRTALVAQEAWIMNATLRDNILMGQPFDEEKYINVVHDSQLMADLHQLTASDMTEIGERGINLSGGQKQRVAFARAVYSGRDIVLMDDPLSAVDSHVCVALMDECVCGALDGRTRVLVTHQVQFLPRADHIIVVKDRSIVFQGTYDELQAEKIDLEELTNSSMASNENEAPVNEGDADDVAAGEANDTPKVETQSSPSKPREKKARETKIPPPRTEDDNNEKITSSEDSYIGDVSVKVLLWYYREQGWGFVFGTFTIYLLWRVGYLFTDMMLSWWSSRTELLGDTPSQDEYLQWYGLLVTFTFLTIVFRMIPSFFGFARAMHNIHYKLLQRIMNAPMEFFDVTPVGRIVNRFSKDIEMIDINIPESLLYFYQIVCHLLGFFGFLCYTAPYLSIFIFVVLILFVIMIRYYIITNRSVKRLEGINRSPTIAIMNESLGGLATIRSYGMIEHFTKYHHRALTNAIRPTYSWRLAQRWVGVRVDTIGASIIMATISLSSVLVVEIYDEQDAKDNFPMFALAITYSLVITAMLSFLSTFVSQLESMMNSVERLYEYSFDLPQERDVEYSSQPTGEHPPPSPQWPNTGDIVFEDVSMRYRKRTPLVLKNISFSIKSGQKIGLVGRTGSGKSSLLLVLFRMVELDGGRLLIDGHDISKLKMRDLREAITIIPQDPLLFEGTLRSNLDPFRKHAPEAVWQALERVGMADRIKEDLKATTLAGGVSEAWLTAPIGERGSNYSVGQRQLLCLARALLKRTRILLLDEATASVDTEADALIQRTIHECFTECTVLTIAHRLQTIIDGDRVVVLDNGRLAEFDTPKKLLDNPDSHFHHMVANLGEDKYNELYKMAKASEEE